MSRIMRPESPGKPANLIYLQQRTRCYMVPPEKKARTASSEHDANLPLPNKLAREIIERGRPHAGFVLILDTETFSFKHAQRARFGFYQLRGIPMRERIALH